MGVHSGSCDLQHGCGFEACPTLMHYPQIRENITIAHSRSSSNFHDLDRHVLWRFGSVSFSLIFKMFCPNLYWCCLVSQCFFDPLGLQDLCDLQTVLKISTRFSWCFGFCNISSLRKLLSKPDIFYQDKETHLYGEKERYTIYLHKQNEKPIR